MAIEGVQARVTTKPLVALLAIATLFAAAGSVQAQYHYLPAPDYYRNDTAEGTIGGGAFGSIIGALLGGKKNRGEGALIGAGVGALTGNLLGRSKDQQDERWAANGALIAAQANRQAAAQAVTNFDLIRLTQAGVGEDVIISTLRARGTRLDLSPTGLISLKQSGVSDGVLIAAQQLNRGPGAIPLRATTTILTEPAPPAVIVTPHPYWMYHHRPHRYDHHHHDRPRVHYQIRL